MSGSRSISSSVEHLRRSGVRKPLVGRSGVTNPSASHLFVCRSALCVRSWLCRKSKPLQAIWSNVLHVRSASLLISATAKEMSRISMNFLQIRTDQWLFLVPLKGGRWHIIPQLAVYTTYIPLIYCLLGGYMLPTTF